MRVVSLGSVRGAPGVTTSSLLLASALGDAVVVEADLDGGVLAVRYGLGREPGLTTFAAAGGDDVGQWTAHAQSAGGVPVMVAPDAATTCVSMWRSAGDRITRQLVAADGTAIVDAGRLRTPVPLVAASDLLLLLVSPLPEHLVALVHQLPAIRAAVSGTVGVALVGDGPYCADDIETSLGVRVFGTLPDDRNAAEVLRNGGSRTRLARSRLARSATALAGQIDLALDAPLAKVAV